MGLELSGLFVYPVKSLRGISRSDSPVTARGLAWDRLWMLVDESGRFVTQRKQPRLCLVGCTLAAGRLRLSAPGMSPLEIPAPPSVGRSVDVEIWSDRLKAADAGIAPARWLSQFLGQPVRLVFLPDASVRRVDPTYGRPGDQTGFSDGFPFLLISEASLEDLNGRLDLPLSMSRFRPNLVVRGCAPYAEDGWRRIRIGSLELRVVKPCSRCIITTVDPETGARGKEPLRTLRSYRERDNKVYFGQNLIHDGLGSLRLGEPVEILETAD